MLFWGVIRVDSFGNELPRDGVKLLILLDVRYNYERSKKELFVNWLMLLEYKYNDLRDAKAW
jgi:hypothetical protein